jgi:hypothetical protein
MDDAKQTKMLDTIADNVAHGFMSEEDAIETILGDPALKKAMMKRQIVELLAENPIDAAEPYDATEDKPFMGTSEELLAWLKKKESK